MRMKQNFEKKSKMAVFQKWPFFKIANSKKKIASFLSKSVQIYMVEWMGRNFDVFPGFQNIP